MKFAIVITALSGLMASVSANGPVQVTVSANGLASKDRINLGFIKIKKSESDPFYTIDKCFDNQCQNRVTILTSAYQTNNANPRFPPLMLDTGAEPHALFRIDFWDFDSPNAAHPQGKRDLIGYYIFTKEQLFRGIQDFTLSWPRQDQSNHRMPPGKFTIQVGPQGGSYAQQPHGQYSSAGYNQQQQVGYSQQQQVGYNQQPYMPQQTQQQYGYGAQSGPNSQSFHHYPNF